MIIIDFNLIKKKFFCFFLANMRVCADFFSTIRRMTQLNIVRYLRKMMCMLVRLSIKLKRVFYFGYVGKNNNNNYHKIQNGSEKSPNSAFLARIACKRH